MKSWWGIFILILISGCSTMRRAEIKPEQKGLLQRLPTTVLSGEPEMIWPIENGQISSYFGRRHKRFHDGIDIRAKRGTPIRAVKDGIVLYSARRIKGYGNMIVIKHAGGLATVYAHNRRNLVKRGTHVKRGQIVAFVGATGRATGPHLHFEVRRFDQAEDPLTHLPSLTNVVVHR